MNTKSLNAVAPESSARPFVTRFAVLPPMVDDPVLGNYDPTAQRWVFPDAETQSAYEMMGTPTRSSTTWMTVDSDKDDS